MYRLACQLCSSTSLVIVNYLFHSYYIINVKYSDDNTMTINISMSNSMGNCAFHYLSLLIL